MKKTMFAAMILMTAVSAFADTGTPAAQKLVAACVPMNGRSAVQQFQIYEQGGKLSAYIRREDESITVGIKAVAPGEPHGTKFLVEGDEADDGYIFWSPGTGNSLGDLVTIVPSEGAPYPMFCGKLPDYMQIDLSKLNLGPAFAKPAQK